MMQRQTADLIALILAVTVALVVVLTAAGILFVQFTEPSEDVASAADAIGKIISVIVGALVGYMAGRKVNGGS